MSSEDSVGTPSLVTPSDRLVGRVKWFNNKAGYGFITVTDSVRAGSDIFVHHSGVVVGSEQYKYLVQGEYVSFKMTHTPGGAHEYQAGDVSGINGGKLMCETRRDFRQTRASYNKTSDDVKESESSPQVRPPRSARPPRDAPTGASAPRARGSGPRDGTEWTMVSGSSTKRPPSTREQATPSAPSTGGRGRGRPPRSKETA